VSTGFSVFFDRARFPAAGRLASALPRIIFDDPPELLAADGMVLLRLDGRPLAVEVSSFPVTAAMIDRHRRLARLTGHVGAVLPSRFRFDTKLLVGAQGDVEAEAAKLICRVVAAMSGGETGKH
jgi:hypothetical protein